MQAIEVADLSFLDVFYVNHRYQHERDDRSMEASWQQIQAEERRSARAGRDADQMAEREEQRRIAEKKAKKKSKKADGSMPVAA